MGTMRRCGIYQIRNLDTNDIYIGQSINLDRRKEMHFYELKGGKHPSKLMQNSYNKHGKDKFVFEILLFCEPFELTRYEQELVNRLNPRYNTNKTCVKARRREDWTEEELEIASNRTKIRKLRKKDLSLWSDKFSGRDHASYWENDNNWEELQQKWKELGI
jgi:group I intron endonuclease